MTDRNWRQIVREINPFTLGTVLTTLILLGAAWAVLRWGRPPLNISIPTSSKATPSSPVTKPSQSLISQLALIPASQRLPYLQQMSQKKLGEERNRARFLLAADAAQQNQPKTVLEVLNGLEKDYPLLASEILVLRAKAFGLNGQPQQANEVWQQLTKTYSKDPAVVEALFVLGQQNPRYWDQALRDFPAHPLSVAIAVERLKKQPNDLSLLKLVAQYGLHLPDLKTYLKRLTDKHAAQLTSEDWHIVGFAYWEKLSYKEAGQAYARAPQSALNFYRAARGLQLGDQKPEAIAAYQKLIATYPQSPETTEALLKLGGLVDPMQARLPYLQKAIQLAQQQGRSHLAAQALASQAQIQGQLKQPAQQAATEKKILSDYKNSEAAASLLWQRVQSMVKRQDLAAARDLSWTIAETAPQSKIAPEASFWAGLWSSQLGDAARQKQAFQFLWTQHPDSYYTWRSGSLSGWPVGDFKTVRDLKPQPNWPTQQLPLASGSAPLKELYLLGQKNLAWQRWLVEFKSREQPTLEQQQTDGLIRVGAGDYLDGIFMLNNLDDRLADEPAQANLVNQWRSHPGFWYALYPLAYYPETAGWAEQVDLNPLLALGLMRQESRFQPQIRSVVGATGLMQIMPETGAWIAQKIGIKTYSLEVPSDNIRFGTWYLNDVHQTYKNDSVLAIASYNAGPGNVSAWVKENQSLNSDEFIEAIPFNETRTYVKAVLENQWNYLRLYDPNYSQLVSK